jgi:hypothetical protein
VVYIIFALSKSYALIVYNGEAMFVRPMIFDSHRLRLDLILLFSILEVSSTDVGYVFYDFSIISNIRLDANVKVEMTQSKDLGVT